MPRAESKRSSGSLVARVAVSTAIAAGAAALLAAVISLLIADRLVLDADDRRLHGAVATALRELEPIVARSPVDAASLKTAIEAEQDELAPESIRVTLRDQGRFVGGDAQLPLPSPGTCASFELKGSTLRACAARVGNLHVVAGTVRAPYDHTQLVLAWLLGAAVAAAAAAIASRRAARWALVPLTRLRDSLDQIGVLGPETTLIVRDDPCREVAILRAALSDLVARLSASLDSARRFSADAAHEMKTPLTVIRAELDLLAEEPLDPSSRGTVEKLRRRVVSLGALVERLLALATAGDRRHLANEAVALEDVARDVVARLADAVRARVVVQADAPGMVLGDEALLAALIENAVDNALKFSGNGRVEVQITEPGGSVVLDVTDEGPGVALADRARAFEPFFRAPASRATDLPGHGVGLSLVAQIASAHDGRAEFVDVHGRSSGARLRITLPMWSARRS